MAGLALTIGGHDLVPSRVHGESRLGELFHFTVEAEAASDAPAVADLLGQPFTLTMQDGFQRSLVVHGVTLDVERLATAGGGAAFAFSLVPEVAPLGLGRDSRVFQEMSAVDIVKDVLQKAGIAADKTRWATTGTYRKRHYCAQYRESDWAFIERLLTEEGIYFWFEHSESSTVLAFGDDSTGAPELEDGALVPFHDDTFLRATQDFVLHVGRRSCVAPQAARLRDYSFEKPQLTLDAAEQSGSREIYDYPGRFDAPADGAQLAKVRLQRLTATAVEVFGETWSTRFRPGLVFEIGDHPVDALNARYLLVSVVYAASALRSDDGGHNDVEITWTAIPVKTPFRASSVAAASDVVARPGGPQAGVVVGAAGQEIQPDASGRVRVQLYWDREGKHDDTASTWMRVGQFALGGSMILPRIGWEVLVNHHEGDADQPVVQSHLYNGQLTVPYALPANKTRTVWQTATTPGGGSSNEIRFEDKAGAEEIFINASKDMNVVTGDNKQEKVAVDSTHTIGSNHDVSISANSVISIGAKQDVSIGGSETLSVSGKRTVVVGGSETATVGGSRTVTATTGCKLEATGARSLTVGGTMTAVAATEVARAVLGSFSATIGGSWIQAAATGLADMTLGVGAETVGGAKIYAAAGGVSTNVKGALAETVGGAYVIAAGGNAAEGATGAHAVTVGGAMLVNAPKVLIEAESEISIRVGGASLTITSSSVEVKAPSLASPGATISKTAGQIHHN
jgi:type VI secretion system secreted protein VgrG